MLMADEAGAEIIVALGTHATLLEFLDKGRAGMSSTFLTRLKVGGRLIDAKGVSQLYRTRISGWWLLLLALSGTFALAIALMATPGGQTFLGLSGAVWDDIVNFFRSLLAWPELTHRLNDPTHSERQPLSRSSSKVFNHD